MTSAAAPAARAVSPRMIELSFPLTDAYTVRLLDITGRILGTQLVRGDHALIPAPSTARGCVVIQIRSSLQTANREIFVR